MIIISPSRSLKQPYMVTYTGRNNEPLSTSELLKSKKACFKNILAMSMNFDTYTEYGTTEIEVWDKTVKDSEPFVYDINGVRKKAGIRK